MAFDPDSQAPLSDSWSITANDGLGAHVISFTGTGLAPLTPTVSVDWINLVRPTSGTTTATFTLSLSAPSPSTTSVTVRTLDGTATVANGDYVPITGQVVTFAPGQTTATVAVTVNGKVATHSYFGLQMIPPYAGVTVEDDYGRANLLEPADLAHEFVYVGPAGVMQTTADAQTAEVPVTASPHTDTITCTVNTADGTATAADGDYTRHRQRHGHPGPRCDRHHRAGDHPHLDRRPARASLHRHPQRLLDQRGRRRPDRGGHHRRLTDAPGPRSSSQPTRSSWVSIVASTVRSPSDTRTARRTISSISSTICVAALEGIPHLDPSETKLALETSVISPTPSTRWPIRVLAGTIWPAALVGVRGRSSRSGRRPGR